jgi:hypothetical protein
LLRAHRGDAPAALKRCREAHERPHGGGLEAKEEKMKTLINHELARSERKRIIGAVPHRVTASGADGTPARQSAGTGQYESTKSW